MTTNVNTIWNDFNRELKAFIFNKVRNSIDTDDILQDVFLKIIQNMDKVDKSENIRQYIYAMVRNAVNDFYRRKRNIISDIEIPEQISQTESTILNETIAACCIKPFINQLPENYKEALIITEFQNLSQKQLAEKLNISYSGAKSRVQRGKEKLKQLLINCCAYQSDKYGNLLEAENKNCNCN